MGLKQHAGGKSSSFEWKMNRPMGGLLQIQSFEPSYHLHPVCEWKLGLDALRLHILESADMF
jgi:hypothetical protein